MLHLSILTMVRFLSKVPKNTLSPVKEWVKYDERVKMYRAQAFHYAPILRLHGKYDYTDEAQDYKKLDINLDTDKTPRTHQAEAFFFLESCQVPWCRCTANRFGELLWHRWRAHISREILLVVVPTIDLLNQWSEQLAEAFKCEVGMIAVALLSSRYYCQ